MFRTLRDIQKNIQEGDNLLSIYEKVVITDLEKEIFAVYENRGKNYYSPMKFYLLDLIKGLIMKQIKEN